jgi:nitrate reductase assembly molybdenum cofactor insertion protein NarJ
MKRPLARSVLYKFLAKIFAYPREALSPGLGPEVVAAAADLGIEKPFRVLARRWLGLSRWALEDEYIRSVGHAAPATAPCHETGYGVAHAFQQTAELGDIAGFYRSQGLRAEGGERPDHLSVELEFMAFLALKEATNDDRAAEVRDVERKFLEEHLGRWAPMFAAALRSTGRSFALAGRALEDLVTFEFGELGTRPAAVRPLDVSPVRFAVEGACFSCGGNP